MMVAMVIAMTHTHLAYADVFQVNAGLSTGHFIEGINVTDRHPIAFLGADWSFDNGAFTGGECYQSSSDPDGSLSRGCHFFAGYFSQINENQAITFELRHKEYLISDGNFWRYFEGTVDWHFNKNVTLSARVSDDWLDQGYASVAFGADYSRPLSSTLTAYGLVDVMKFESVADVDYTEHYEFGIKYQKERLSIGLSAIFADPSLSEQIWFDVNENQLRLTVSYRLY